jgi:hypothetical protein
MLWSKVTITCVRALPMEPEWLMGSPLRSRRVMWVAIAMTASPAAASLKIRRAVAINKSPAGGLVGLLFCFNASASAPSCFCLLLLWVEHERLVTSMMRPGSVQLLEVPRKQLVCPRLQCQSVLHLGVFYGPLIVGAWGHSTAERADVNRLWHGCFWRWQVCPLSGFLEIFVSVICPCSSFPRMCRSFHRLIKLCCHANAR